MSVHDCVPSFDPLPMHFRLRCVSALASGAVYVSICGLQDAQDCLGMLYCSLAEIPSCINRLLTSNSIKRDIIGENFQENLSRKLEFSSWSFLCFKAKYVLGWVLCLFAWYIRPGGGGGGPNPCKNQQIWEGGGGVFPVFTLLGNP